uniref:Tumor protein p53-inducible protein 11 n=1 Tax=Anas platyrhynchos platyrhynchos TaxID=8840 RepID=U3IEZ8_ANAPP
RSKISQVLGNEIKFAVREPLGLRVWQLVSAVMFSGVAIMALAFPDQLYDTVFNEESASSKTPIRLYGGALLSECCASIWGVMLPCRAIGREAKRAGADKFCVWKQLLLEFFFLWVSYLFVSRHQPLPYLPPSPPVTTVSLVESSRIATGAVLLLVSRILFVLISIYYYYQVGRRPKKV